MQTLKMLLVFLVVMYTGGLAQIQLQEAFPNLTFTNPVDFQYAKDGTNRIFVIEQAGIIRVFQNSSSVSASKVFLDITDKTKMESDEMGLLGLSFHPDYQKNGYFYVNYTVSTPKRQTMISRFNVSSSNPDSADKNSEVNLLAIDQPFTNHKGGQVRFGPDGLLYLALGDGGSEGDKSNNAQNKSSLLGKILRIDVNSTQDTLQYAIPVSNPFKSNTNGYREEIYAYGLRNPWRFSFDPVTGLLWCGEVGQDMWEEIDIIQKGKNYGWHCFEGYYPYDTTGCNGRDYVFPNFTYYHVAGNCCIIGGSVYRGNNVPELYGKYIYSDYCSKNIWSLQFDNTGSPVDTLLLTSPFGKPLAFGTDQNNEIYLCADDGKLYTFKPTVVSVKQTGINPNEFSLNQNYPNPFNPSTSIVFNVPEQSKVNVRIVDVLGRVIEVLFDGNKSNGKYTLNWTPTNSASGIYIVQMIAQSLVSTKSYNKLIKMIYLK